MTKPATPDAQAEPPDRIAEIRQRAAHPSRTQGWVCTSCRQAHSNFSTSGTEQLTTLPPEWVCLKCGGQLAMQWTWTGEPSVEQDRDYLLDLVASLQSRLQQADAELAALRAEQAGLMQLRDDAQTENALLNAEVTRVRTQIAVLTDALRRIVAINNETREAEDVSAALDKASRVAHEAIHSLVTKFSQ